MSAVDTMRLDELLAGHADAGAAGAVRVSGLGLDSRALRPGEAFVALDGTRQHGLAFAPAAQANGAAVVLAEPARTAGEAVDPQLAVPLVWVPQLRARVGALADRFYREPSRGLRVVGVTGTNGKTSTVQLLAQALDHLGRRPATIGTLGAGLHGALVAGERTTPDAISVQRLLAGFRDAGATDVAMEVSSHALDQGRVGGVRFAVGVFTNLTRDHLDYHGDMQAYADAKRRLFTEFGVRTAVLNLDDAFGRALRTGLPDGTRAITYGTVGDADVRADAIRTHADGLSFQLRTPWGDATIASPLLGRFNVANLLAVAATLGALGHGGTAIGHALAALRPVDGRMNRIGGGDAPLIVVDYAHTPDALEQTLANLRAHCAGELVCVFGCGGERDAGKRPQMGAIAERLADRIVVTDDNPRGENGDAIVADIVAGLAHPIAARIERDRATAIRHAVRDARAGDVVLIAGKGHEPYQEIGGERRPFDDLAVARAALEARAC